MELGPISEWARLKGVDLIGTGDFTHPGWLKGLEKDLVEKEYGIFEYNGIRFMLTAEISATYWQGERFRKVHIMIIAPSFEAVHRANKVLAGYGDLALDGRPTVKVPCDKLVRELRAESDGFIFIPAHAWTPHFSVFGANSGFDGLEDCFGDQTGFVPAIETGLSSDPPMNWRLSGLDRISLVSNSDAHSLMKIGREANVFSGPFGYKELEKILKDKDRTKFLFTVEFFPEEGKYHWDGHSPCGARLSPRESKDLNYRCPRCGANVTVGVMHRVEKLADRPEGFILKSSPSYVNTVPLIEIIGSALEMGVQSKAVQREYMALIKKLGNEFRILIELSDEEISAKCPAAIAQGILNVRRGALCITPGYDGEYGKVDVFGPKCELAAGQRELF